MTNGLIRDEARPQFDAAVDSALRLRNSMVVELLLIVFVYAVGMPFVWRDQLALDREQLVRDGRRTADLQPSYAGLLARSREHARGPVPDAALVFPILRLGALPVAGGPHPAEPGTDAPGRHRWTAVPGAHGRAYRLVLLALGAVLSGMIANRIFYAGAKLLEFKVEIVGTVVVLVFLVLGPLIVFYPQLRAARRKGMEEYGTLGQAYAREFNQKWIAWPAPGRRTAAGQRRHPVARRPA